jgi:hypothetical protein
MATENPIKYSDFILPDASVKDLIEQLETLQATYIKMLKKVRGEANDLEKSLAKVSGATEEGREANRRIEFWLIRPEPSAPERQTTLESIAETGDNGTQDGTEDAAGSNASEPSEDATE